MTFEEMFDPKNLVWVVMRCEEGKEEPGPEECVGLEEALGKAAAIVGNCSYAHPPGTDLYFFGPGDGSTTVIVRQVPKRQPKSPAAEEQGDGTGQFLSVPLAHE